MHIKGKIVTLRAPEPADLPRLNAWANDPELWHNLTGWHFPYSTASTARWIEERGRPNLSYQVFCIDTPGDGLVGTATFESIDWKNRGLNLGLMIGDPAARGKGYALDANLAILRFAFDEMGMNRIEGHVLAYNARSRALYEGKIGFRQEGVRREAYFRDGAFHDDIVYGMTLAEYRANPAVAAYWAAGKA